ncbi:MAG: helix-turn-helix transcriptional regulator [Clostridia bacterium]|nr:helix-turn-helix transcriptional regulator [Clostridia bacterium]
MSKRTEKNTGVSFEHYDKHLEFGFNVTVYRKKAGMTQWQLAEKAGISRQYMSVIEAPNMISNVSMEILFKLADALNISPIKLLEFRD